MGNLIFDSAERPGNPIDAAEIPVVWDNDVAIGQGARPTERPEKNTAAARHMNISLKFSELVCLKCNNDPVLNIM